MRATGIGWFNRLNDEERRVLLAQASRREVRTAQSVVRRGDPATELFIVLRGKLKASAVNEGGRQTTFDILQAGDVFGEIGLFTQGVRTADVSALEPCELITLRKEELIHAIRLQPTIAIALFQVMAERVTSLSDEREDVEALDAGTRFARSLLKLAERFGVEPLPQNLQVQLKLSQQDLAELVGVSRVFANGKLRGWQEQGILTHKAGRLTVHDLSALRRAAGVDAVADAERPRGGDGREKRA